jgi:hypothetical protein
MQVCGVQTLSEWWLGILLWVQWLENESKLTQKKKGNRYQPQNCEPIQSFLGCW